jgi:ligand-binding SRPBCC domain-containing protein
MATPARLLPNKLMMRIKLKSQIAAPYELVQRNFDKELFRYLLPPSFVASLTRYDGAAPGNEVHVQFHVPWKSLWISRIIQTEQSANFFYFIDEGIRLPFGLRTWKHRHSVIKMDDVKTEIVDDIHFGTQNKMMDLWAWPILFLAFYPRKWQYQSFFSKTQNR